ncbi:MAG: type II secretion system major pseudopilin GspG [Candidatus Nealsonbacteria bacterium]|nr:type II secretion system major pseudopilin GspG [Candidatus Nealsonbacteria bacterium]
MKRSSTRRRRGGFTLIEVLLVLVILVVLGALAATAYGPIQRRANINAAKSQIGLFKTTLGTYQLLVSNYPGSQEGLEALINPPAGIAADLVNDWPILDADRVPLDPWDNAYGYQSPGTHNTSSYDIWSAGPDMVEGNADDIGNWTTE